MSLFLQKEKKRKLSLGWRSMLNLCCLSPQSPNFNCRCCSVSNGSNIDHPDSVLFSLAMYIPSSQVL